VGAESAAWQLQGLGLLLGRAVMGAEAKREQLQAAFRGADARQRGGGAAGAGAGGWLCSPKAVAAWDQLAQACLLVKPRLPSLQSRLALDASVHLPATGALLLAARSAAPGARAVQSKGGGDDDEAMGSGAGGQGGGAEGPAAWLAAGEVHAASLLADAKDELEELR
jgi:hypothetical protein